MVTVLALAAPAATQTAAQPTTQPTTQPAEPADPAQWAGRTVLEVAVTIGGEPTVEPRWLSLVETPPGSQLSPLDLRATLLHFFNAGMFAGAEAVIEPVGTAGGIRVTYRLTPTHAVSGLSFRGDLGVDDGELRRIVVDRFGAQPAAGRADAAAEVLTARLVARGFLQARVTPALETDPRGRTTLRFDVAAGRRARIGKVTIEGDGLPPRLRSDLGLATGALYDGPEIEQQLERVQARLRRDGHYEATGIMRATAAGTSPAGDPLIDVVVTITPGPLVTLRWEGDPIPEARRAGAGAGGARGIGRRGPARGFAAPDRAVPLPAGALEGGSRLSPRRDAGRPGGDVHREGR